VSQILKPGRGEPPPTATHSGNSADPHRSRAERTAYAPCDNPPTTTDPDAGLLRDTVDNFLCAVNYVTRHPFRGEHVTTSKTTLHDDTDEYVRDETALHVDFLYTTEVVGFPRHSTAWLGYCGLRPTNAG
jgi:hypothetical protein